MPERERERIGLFVITDRKHLDPGFVICANCGKRLAKFGKDGIDPSPESLVEEGAVAWPNFGWFCSVPCEKAYAAEFKIRNAERVARKPS